MEISDIMTMHIVTRVHNPFRTPISRKIIFFCLAFCLPAIMMAAPLTLVSESQEHLDLSFELPNYELTNVTSNGQTWNKIICEEGTYYSNEGFPELITFSTAIAVPVDGDITYSIESISTQTIKNVNILPASTLILNGEEVTYDHKPNYKAYANRELYPVSIVQKGEPAFVGNRKFVPLLIYPFQYRAQSKELLVHSQISVSIYINGTKSAAKNWQLNPNPLDNSDPPFFLNENSSKTWRLEKKPDAHYEAPKNGSSAINEIQLIVDKEGIYKVNYYYLTNYINLMSDSLQVIMNWTPANVDPRYLELRDEYGQVPIHFIGENDGVFNENDYFEFYGDRHKGDTGYQDDYTAENVYTLSLVDHYGARMAVENGGLIESNSLHYIVPDAYEETVYYEEQLVSDKLGQGWNTVSQTFYREDVWFWRKINAPNLEIVPVELQYPKDTTTRFASAKVCLMGLTYSETLTPGQYDHEASIRLNQAMINSHTWIGQREQMFVNQNPVSNTFLRHGINNFYIALSGNTVMTDKEQVLLDWAEIKYWREYKTDQDYIKFTKPSNRPGGLYQFEVSGFSNSAISVYKIGSSVFNSTQIEPFNINGDAPWTVTIQDSVASDAVRYFAVTENKKNIPKAIRLNFPSDLKNPDNSADVIVITPRQFTSAEGTLQLKSLWESEGHTVKIVDVQDIYDEFNAGITGAEPIQNFLRYAYNNWNNPQLSHVILLGEGTDDNRDNSPSRIYNLIPVKKTWTYKHGATASDTWYGCIVGTDIIPDISVARISVWQEQQILDYAAKAIAYRNNPQTSRLWNSHLTFTSGGKITDNNDIFAQQSERIIRKTIPEEYRVTRVYTSTQTVGSDYFGGTFNLKDAINSGTQYVQFMGHGGGRIWADYNLFNFNDVATLNNQVYPVVLSLACYASAFDTNGMASISEALVLQPEKGAIGTAGFTGLGYLDHDETWGLAYCEALFGHNFANIGIANIFALARFYTTTYSPASMYALINGFAYLGDPLIKLKKPIKDIPVFADNYVLNPGDTLKVNATFPTGANAGRLFIMKGNGKIVNIPYDLPVFPNGNWSATYVNTNPSENNYTRKIMVGGYSSTDEYIGLSQYSVGRPNIMHLHLTPAEPAWSDSVLFTARVFSPLPVTNMICKVRTDSVSTQGTWIDIPMQRSEADSTVYITTQYLGKYHTGKEIFFKYVMETEESNAESFLENYIVRGPDLVLKDIKLEQEGNSLVLKVLGTNIGNAASITTDLKLYAGITESNLTLFSTKDYLPLEVGEQRWDSISLAGLPNANLFLEARVNTTNAFSEWHFFINTNNYIRLRVPMNYFLVDSSGATLNSIDNNLSCQIPVGLVPPGQQILFALNTLEALSPLNQPDVQNILLNVPDGISGNQYSIPYEIVALGPEITDSLGVLNGNKKLTLTFNYSASDSLTQAQEGGENYKIYRYNSEFKKWILVGGIIEQVQNEVHCEVNRTGIYSIFRNTDYTPPTVDVNVEDQEFTVGGYIAGNGVISLLLSDANGIDVIDHSISLFLNGVSIPEEDYVISINQENINRIPIKYQLSLGRGIHELKVRCSDLNGFPASRDIQFTVNDKFDVINLANYPNPVLGAGSEGAATNPINEGRTRFTYVLTDGADEVTIKVYTISGRLVKTFKNLPVGVGYHEYPRTVYGWDCKDDSGFTLANGVYFYRIIAKRGNKTIEKTQKMAILN
ncbi:MAG: Gingipain R2 precursor [Candidatus Cloacimonetes bacterium ADurb.Bin089]|nr:MAG: Gingipain R2 precursor [Candidatus Cloacimonetes bacterium ADurb.Bin089]